MREETVRVLGCHPNITVDDELSAKTLLKKLNEGNYDDVPNQIKRWNKAGGQTLAGLTKRRASEAHLFETGEVVH